MKQIALARIGTHVVNKECTGDELKEVKKSGETINWAEDLLGIPEIWKNTQGEGIKVAVLDTGIDEDHVDLRDAIVSSKDFTRQGILDLNGHGTHCAGIVGARRNGEGFIGLAPKCELIIGKVLGNDGLGTLRQVADGIDWAVSKGADIISMSLGSSASSLDLYESVHRALAAGVSVICAVGNSGSRLPNNIDAPAIYGSVISVGAHDANGNPAGFSSRGGEIDVMAPGVKIWSTYKNGGYALLDGTSMATPIVAGIAALILAKHKANPTNHTPINHCEDMRQHILRMASQNGYHENDRGYGVLMPTRYFFN